MTREPTDEEVFAAMNAVAAWDHLAFADADSYRENIDRFLRHALQGALPLIERALLDRLAAFPGETGKVLADMLREKARDDALKEARDALAGEGRIYNCYGPRAADFIDRMRSGT